MKGINNNKALGCDSFDAFFFKKVWPTVEDEIIKVVQEFLSISKLHKALNCTTVTLISKTAHPSKNSDFKPIFYYTLLYKIISKVLTNKMQHVMNRIIDKNQYVFVPRSSINDNIILSNELVKGHERTGISSRCMLKVDTRKNYGLVE